MKLCKVSLIIAIGLLFACLTTALAQVTAEPWGVLLNKESAWGGSFSPDAKLFAVGDADNVVFWDVQSTQIVKTVPGHENWVTTTAFSPDGKSLVSGARDRTIRLFSIDDPSNVKIITGHNTWINKVVFRPNGQQFISSGEVTGIKVWNASNGLELREFVGHKGSVRDIAVSKDGVHLYSAAFDKTVKTWVIDRGVDIKTFPTNPKDYTAIDISPDGQYIALAGHDRTVTVWNASTGGEVMSFTHHKEKANCVAFSPDSKVLASGGNDRQVMLYDLAKKSLITTLSGHPGWIESITFSKDGKFLASCGGNDQMVRLYALTGIFGNAPAEPTPQVLPQQDQVMIDHAPPPPPKPPAPVFEPPPPPPAPKPAPAPAVLSNPDGAAIIIGNREYIKFPELNEDLQYAHADAKRFGKYVRDVLGFKKANVKEANDVSATDLAGYFGSQTFGMGELGGMVMQGKTDLIVYFAGAVLVDPADGKAYLMGMDGNPTNIKKTGYPVEQLVSNLQKLKARSVLLVLDAELPALDVKGPYIGAIGRGKSPAPTINEHKASRLSYLLLKGMENRNADSNRDGKVTLGELKSFILNSGDLRGLTAIINGDLGMTVVPLTK